MNEREHIFLVPLIGMVICICSFPVYGQVPRDGKKLVGDFYPPIAREPEIDGVDATSRAVFRKLTYYWHPAEFKGQLIVKVTLNRSGHVDNVIIVESSGHDSQDRDFLSAIRNVSFPLGDGYTNILRRAKSDTPIDITTYLLIDNKVAQYCTALQKFYDSIEINKTPSYAMPIIPLQYPSAGPSGDQN